MDQVPETILEINSFSYHAGPELNMSKTEGLAIGTDKYLSGQFFGISFHNKPIRLLGIFVGHDKDECNKLNWDKQIKSIEKRFGIMAET